MKQQINLYQPILRRERRLFSALALAKSFALIAVGVVAISLAAVWGVWRQERDLAQLQEQRAELVQRVALLEARYPAPRADQDLAATVVSLERELTMRRRFLERFDPAVRPVSRSFAPPLRGLAGRRVEGVWLRELYLWGDGRMALHGSMTEAELLPRFIEGLSQESAFRGREFRDLRMQRSDSHLEFVLRSAGVER